MQNEQLLQKINSPADLKMLTLDEMKLLAGEIRQLIIDVVSKNGGHLAPNLGVVELTLALHKVFTTPKDKIIWDVGHQSYIHKILTGRKDQFPTLRQYKGLSGFPKRKESEHDAFGTGHSSTSISAALGMAVARDLKGEDNNVIAVIGDGSMTGGMSFEALNNAGDLHKKMIVILNDNEMSISKNVGAMSQYLCDLRTGETYNKIKHDVEGWLKSLDFGTDVLNAIERVKGSVKYLMVPSSVFEELGFKYLGPIDGHDLNKLLEVLEAAKHVDGPVLVHVITKKGKGYAPAEEEPVRFHSAAPFDIATGKGVVKSGAKQRSYTQVFSEKIASLAASDKKIVAITAAMPEGTGLDIFRDQHPNRFFDVGIAEGHAVSFAGGLAKEGLKPVVAIYSTFLQRAYDQIFECVTLQNVGVVFCLDRAGVVGDDGATHQGVFDIAYLRNIPNMIIMAPRDAMEFENMLAFAVGQNKPVALRYPKDTAPLLRYPPSALALGKAEILCQGKEFALIAFGSMVKPACEAAEILRAEGISGTVVNARFAKPLDAALLKEIAGNTRFVFTVEDGVLDGGFGSAVKEVVDGPVVRIGLPDEFLPCGKRDALLAKYGLSGKGIAQTIKTTMR